MLHKLISAQRKPVFRILIIQSIIIDPSFWLFFFTTDDESKKKEEVTDFFHRRELVGGYNKVMITSEKFDIREEEINPVKLVSEKSTLEEAIIL